MKIEVFGTCSKNESGHQELYPNPRTVLDFDLRNGQNVESTLGRYAYSIHLNNDSVIFSKYIITRNNLKSDSRIGFIAFWVTIPNDKKIAGKNIQTMLDDLAQSFIDKQHIGTDYRVGGPSFSDRSEDWDFISYIKNKYNDELEANHLPLSLKQNNDNRAFAYYSDDDELRKFLNADYQQYSTYKQVFFVKEDNNPLAAWIPMREIKIDLESRTRNISKNEHKLTDIENSTHRPSDNVKDDSKSPSEPKNTISKIIIVLAVLLALLAIAYNLYDRHISSNLEIETNKERNKERIIKYVIGDTLFLDILEKYKKNWDEFFTRDNEEWNRVSQSIDSAITKRKLINNLDFANLGKFHYSDPQQKFRIAIEKIDSTRYREIKEQLKNISALTLTQVADSINIIDDELVRREKQRQSANSNSNVKIDKQNNSQKPDPLTLTIQKYLKGDELDEEKLKEYKGQTKDNNLKNSIKLALDFWELNVGYHSFYHNKVKKDPNFDSSKLKKFLEKMCDKEKTPNPSYRKMDKKRGLK